MRSKLEPGCTALVVRSKCPENVGKILKVLECIGVICPKIDPGQPYWKVDQKMKVIKGNYRYHSAQRNLQRIDDDSDPETEEIKEELNAET